MEIWNIFSHDDIGVYVYGKADDTGAQHVPMNIKHIRQPNIVCLPSSRVPMLKFINQYTLKLYHLTLFHKRDVSTKYKEARLYKLVLNGISILTVFIISLDMYNIHNIHIHNNTSYDTNTI